MHIEVIANIGEARSDEFLHKTVIVVDVLRATSTIITALMNGSRSVVPVDTVIKAKEYYREGDVLGGERYCKKIPGFDFGNSPLEYTREAVGGKRVILTTTNGTRGIYKAMKASHVLAGAIINGRAAADVAIELKRDVVIVCAGTQDVFSLEDGLCAGLILEEIAVQLGDSQTTNDLGLAMRGCYLEAKDRLLETILACSNGKKMKKSGFLADVELCAIANMTDCVPVLEQDQMVPFQR